MSSAAKQVNFGQSPFTFEQKEKHFWVILRGELDDNQGREFERQSPEKISPVTTDIVVSLDQCEDFHPAWIRLLMQLITHAKSHKKKVRFVGANYRISDFFRKNGVESSFVCVPTVEAAESDFAKADAPPAAKGAAGAAPAAKAAAKKLDVNFVNAFLTATVEVLKVQCKTDAKGSPPQTRDARASLDGDISGIIGLVSDAFNGSVVISFPEATFLAIMSRMLGEEYRELTPEIRDGASELTNIIFGQAKKQLNAQNYNIKMAIPSVVSGKNHTIQNAGAGPRISVPFKTDAGDFTFEIILN